MTIAYDLTYSLVEEEDIRMLPDEVLEWRCPACPSDAPTYHRAEFPTVTERSLPVDRPQRRWTPEALASATLALRCLGTQHTWKSHPDLPRAQAELNRRVRELRLRSRAQRISEWWARR